MSPRFALRYALAGAGLFLLPASAMAWKHVEPPMAWHPDELPFEYCVAPADDCGALVFPDSPDKADYCARVMEEAHRAWDVGAPCANLGGGELLGECEPIPCPPRNLLRPDNGMCQNLGFEMGDPRNTVGYGDPNEELEVGVLAANLTLRVGAAFILNGTQYYWGNNSDIVFNNNVNFATHEEIVAGQCNGRINMRSVATHEVGHLYGMGHSCDEFEPCNDPELRGAVMFWTSGPCETLVDIQQDDIIGINTLYGPSAGFACSHQVSDDLAIGVVPFEMKCVVDSPGFINEIVDARWSFGDGNMAEGTNVSNLYEKPGNYTVELTVKGERDTCASDDNPDGMWDSSTRKVGFVRACGLPDVAFTYEHVDGLTYQMFNESDVSVFGCIQDIEWQVYEGQGVNGAPIADLTRKGWEPQITFPKAGEFTVVMNVGGPAGTSAAMITIDARNRRGEGRGCSSTAGMGLGSAGMLALVGLLGIRRRR